MSCADAGTSTTGMPGCPAVNRAANRSCRAAVSARAACRRSSPSVVAAVRGPVVRVGELLGGGQRPRGRQGRRGHALDPVHDEAGERHTLLVEAAGEEGRLAQRVALGRGDHDEGRLGLLEQGVGLVGALAETAEHRVERGDEGLHVLEQLAAEHLGEGAGHDVAPRR